MSIHRVLVTGIVASDPSKSNTMIVLQSQRLIPVEDGFRQETTEFYCKISEYLVKQLARFGPGAHVAVFGQFIAHPKFGSPEEQEDGTFVFEIETSDIIVLNQRAADDREDIVYVVGVGNLGRDPETGITQSGLDFTNISVAAERTEYDAEGKASRFPVWFKLTAWKRQSGVIAKFFHKGSSIFFEVLGLSTDLETMGPRTYERRDGGKGTSFSGSLRHWAFASSKGEGGSNRPAVDEPYISPDEDKIPF